MHCPVNGLPFAGAALAVLSDFPFRGRCVRGAVLWSRKGTDLSRLPGSVRADFADIGSPLRSSFPPPRRPKPRPSPPALSCSFRPAEHGRRVLRFVRLRAGLIGRSLGLLQLGLRGVQSVAERIGGLFRPIYSYLGSFPACLGPIRPVSLHLNGLLGLIGPGFGLFRPNFRSICALFSLVRSFIGGSKGHL